MKGKVITVLKMFLWMGIVLAGLYGAYLGIDKIKSMKEGKGKEIDFMRLTIEKQADAVNRDIFSEVSAAEVKSEPTKIRNNSLNVINADSSYSLHPARPNQ